MATLNPEFPQPLMDALEGPEDTEGLVVDFTEEMDSDIEEMPDGSAIVRMPETKGPAEDEDFYENLADEFDPHDLDKLALPKCKIEPKRRHEIEIDPEVRKLM